MTTELFETGMEVPRDWFKRLDNVEVITFMHPCIVETTDERRTIRKAEPVIEGAPMIYVKHFADSDGVMNVMFDRDTVVYMDHTP